MRTPIPKKTQAKVFIRDNWTCRYCGTEVIFSPALKALDKHSPAHGYYDQHGHQNRMAKLLLDCCACADHVTPVALGGTNELENLVCACWKCNLTKGDVSPEQWIVKMKGIQKTPTQGWDGMFSLLEELDPDNEWISIIKNEQQTVI